MLLAKQNETFIEARPGMRAQCPHCGGEVISKCGTIKIWHWAHKVECPYHTEPETEWHLQWKERALKNGFNIEVRNNNHILDAFNPITKTVFEFQHSPISQEELKGRSMDAVMSGYKINWVFDIKRNHFDYDFNNHFKIKYYNRKYDSILQNRLPIYGRLFVDAGDDWISEEIQRCNPNRDIGYISKLLFEIKWIAANGFGGYESIDDRFLFGGL